jgi:hypothetical protein
MHLTRVPLVVSAVWRSKTVTTDPPRYPKHLEWSLEITVAAKEAVRLAVFLDDRSAYAWALPRAPASTEHIESARFFPENWAASDDVCITFGGHRSWVSDALLKSDPRNFVQVLAPSVADAGELVDIAEIQTHGIRLAILAVAEPDTELRRMERWRIKPQFAASLSARVAPLTSGRQQGISDPRDVSDS